MLYIFIYGHSISYSMKLKHLILLSTYQNHGSNEILLLSTGGTSSLHELEDYKTKHGTLGPALSE